MATLEQVRVEECVVPQLWLGNEVLGDLAEALRELVGATRPGGRVALIASGPPEHVESLAFFLGAVRAAIPSLVGDPNAPVPDYRSTERHELLSALATSGLTEITVETVIQEFTFGSGKQLWDWVTRSNPFATRLAQSISVEQQRLVREILDGMLRERAAGNGAAVLIDENHIAIGTK